MKLSESRSLRKITISLLINKGYKDFEDLETQGPRYNFVPINPKDEREQVKESGFVRHWSQSNGALVLKLKMK